LFCISWAEDRTTVSAEPLVRIYPDVRHLLGQCYSIRHLTWLLRIPHNKGKAKTPLNGFALTLTPGDEMTSSVSAKIASTLAASDRIFLGMGLSVPKIYSSVASLLTRHIFGPGCTPTDTTSSMTT
jgi:hypothetical protein